VAGVLATALLAAGCATVPTKGPIRSIGQDGPAANSGGAAVEAQPPRPGAGPIPLVNGFLEAMSDSTGFDVAREYMTATAGGAWKPETTIVYDQSAGSGVASVADGRVHLSAPWIASIDSRGSWIPAPQNKKLDFYFDLTKVSNELRVANPPPGVFLGSNQLQSKLESRALYFFNPSKHLLVPDPVLLPFSLTQGQEATQLIQELLKGPTTRLGNSVVSVAPPGTTVDVSVPVESGVATVALSDTAASLTDPTDRERLAAQIAWTLRPITKIKITVEGAPLLPEQPEVSYSDFSSYDPAVPGGRLKDLFGLRNGKVQRIQGQDDGQTIEAKPLDTSQLYDYSAKSFAVSLRAETGAIVTTTKGGTPVVVTGRLDGPKNDEAESLIPVEGKTLRPSFDSEENLWIVDRADSAKPRLRVRTADGKLSTVLTKFGDLGRPVELRMAPDGVRALLLMQKDGVNSVLTATIGNTDDKQLELNRFRPLQLPLAEITDVSWNNQGVLVAGKSSKTDPPRPWQVNVDGSQPHQIPGASSQFDAVRVASNPNLDTLPAVQDSTGKLHWQGKDLTWVDMADGPEGDIEPVYPG
jgi:lipoprotein LpqB-like beta-propeller protein/sporulation and spore germination protein